MILLRLRLEIVLALGCLGLGAFFLNQSFQNSGQDVLVVVLVAPVLCALGLLLLGISISHYRRFREWEKYCRQNNAGEPRSVREVFSKS